ncbi:sugar phosphate nucleotidyltransferase [Bacillus cereus]|nr:sugar phosphate nucleotidyltransferase [Bacillus cereus]MDA2079905.1 sugar phosphate nucleotidyltransferase [Bacillus cereus]MDA2085495.1 sugar phosphate nucleotidyltransferase [Bacillus cereus]MDA2178597.1 sugar phosphate nucleotidyltransferase [Bacillus cereus]
MKVVILCGGQGLRIREVEEGIPKAMIKVGDKPILEHIMDIYSSFGYKEFILCLGYKGNLIKDYFVNYYNHNKDFTINMQNNHIEYHTSDLENDYKITFVETGKYSNTATRLKYVMKYLNNDENFMLTYADGLANINLKELVKYHYSHGKILTISGVKPMGRFGAIKFDAKGRIIEFNEKKEDQFSMVSGGYFVCNSNIIDYLDSETMLEEGTFTKLVREKQMMVYEHEGFWQPMDTYKDYILLNEMIEKGRNEWLTKSIVKSY